VFHDIPISVLNRIEYLENIDNKERTEEICVERFNRLRQIPPETGRFIALMAAASPKGNWIEIGTSAGYSTLWLTLACKCLGTKITTFELDPEKIRMAKETFMLSDVEKHVELVPGNALNHLPDYTEISFCFLDTEKELYSDCYDIVIPNMVPGGILLADNVISHQSGLQSMIDKAQADRRVDSVIVPIGQGILMCRKK